MTQSSRSPTPHQDYFVDLLRVLEPHVQTEVPAVFPNVRIDAVVDFDAAGPFWGPIRPLLSQRRVGFEHVSGSVSRVDWLDWSLEAAALSRRWLLTRDQRRQPLLFAIVVSRPPRWLRAMLRPVQPGLWLGRRSVGYQLAVLSIAALPNEFGNTGLHLLREPSDTGGGDAARAFLRDPLLPLELRDQLYEAFMNHKIRTREPLTFAEYLAAVEEGEATGRTKGEEIGRAKGEEIGRAKGEEIGRAKGEHRAALAFAAELLGADAARELEHLSAEAIRAAVVKAVRG